MKNTYLINSPNVWFSKVGIKVDENGTMKLPMKFLILPLATASDSMSKYNESLGWGDKTQLTQSVALNIRSADTTYFDTWSRSIVFMNPQAPSCFPCLDCFKRTLSPGNLRKHINPRLSELRDLINDSIIHATENNKLITPDTFELAKQYYDEFLKLNMFNFSEVNGLTITFCKKHAHAR